MCFSIQRPLPHKPKNNSGRTSFPPFSLGWGEGRNGRADCLEIETWKWEPRAWRKSLECLGVGEIPLLPRNNRGQSPRGSLGSSLCRTTGHPIWSRCATAASGSMTGVETQQGRLGPVGKRKARHVVSSSQPPPCPRHIKQPP